MKVRHIKARLHATFHRHQALVRRKLLGLYKIDPKLAVVCMEIGNMSIDFPKVQVLEDSDVCSEVPKVKVIRKKDGELFGMFTLSEAYHAIAKAKVQKKATLVIA